MGAEGTACLFLPQGLNFFPPRVEFRQAQSRTERIPQAVPSTLQVRPVCFNGAVELNKILFCLGFHDLRLGDLVISEIDV